MMEHRLEHGERILELKCTELYIFTYFIGTRL